MPSANTLLLQPPTTAAASLQRTQGVLDHVLYPDRSPRAQVAELRCVTTLSPGGQRARMLRVPGKATRQSATR